MVWKWEDLLCTWDHKKKDMDFISIAPCLVESMDDATSVTKNTHKQMNFLGWGMFLVFT